MRYLINVARSSLQILWKSHLVPSLVPVPCSPNRASTSITPCTNSIRRRQAAAKLLMVHPAESKSEWTMETARLALQQNINKLNIFEHANAAADFDDNFGEEEEDYEVDDDNSGDENYGRSAKMQGKGGLTTGIFTQRPNEQYHSQESSWPRAWNNLLVVYSYIGGLCLDPKNLFGISQMFPTFHLEYSNNFGSFRVWTVALEPPRLFDVDASWVPRPRHEAEGFVHKRPSIKSHSYHRCRYKTCLNICLNKVQIILSILSTRYLKIVTSSYYIPVSVCRTSDTGVTCQKHNIILWWFPYVSLQLVSIPGKFTSKHTHLVLK